MDTESLRRDASSTLSSGAPGVAIMPGSTRRATTFPGNGAAIRE